jgi:hypothetical protein
MNKVTMKSRATLLGQAFASKGVTLTRAEQLDLVAQLEGAHDWHHASSEMARSVPDAAAPEPFSALQQEGCNSYCSGEYSGMSDEAEVESVGDTLFAFVIRELGDAGDDREEGARMLRAAADELLQIAERLEAEPTADTASPVAGHGCQRCAEGLAPVPDFGPLRRDESRPGRQPSAAGNLGN